ncbi:MAG TPA: aldehyde dehydrogenase family protein, partial [Brevibacterium sp.]|nr:aldehyde dehydrogenase family protein [Brevibacterium sp.]
MLDAPHSPALTIDGEAVDGAAAPLTVINPATEQPLAQAPAATPGQLDSAVSAARTAYGAWRARSWNERRDAVLAYAAAL